MTAISVGILGVGLYLPPDVRRNDWWPKDVVDGWMKSRPPRKPPALEGLPEGARRVVEAMGKQALDPFQGAVERRVMGPGMSVFDMEEQAARAAIARAGVDIADIDLVLTHTVVPDHLVSNTACQVHHRLGLSRRCFAMQTEAAAYAFMLQMTIADSMIKSGQAHCALLVQSCGASPIVDYTNPISVLFGDGATAVVLGPVTTGRGIVAAVHFANGEKPNSLVAGVPGGRWYDEGRGIFHIADPAHMQAAFLETADVCKSCIDAVLAEGHLTTKDVDVLAIYQGTPWLREIVTEYAGLTHARTIETFARTGYLCSGLIPAGLAMADQDGDLQAGQLIAMAGGGTGMTCGGILLRWGT